MYPFLVVEVLWSQWSFSIECHHVHFQLPGESLTFLHFYGTVSLLILFILTWPFPLSLLWWHLFFQPPLTEEVPDFAFDPLSFSISLLFSGDGFHSHNTNNDPFVSNSLTCTSDLHLSAKLQVHTVCHLPGDVLELLPLPRSSHPSIQPLFSTTVSYKVKQDMGVPGLAVSTKLEIQTHQQINPSTLREM